MSKNSEKSLIYWFENFLEVFLRKSSPTPRAYVGAMHKAIFEGAVPSAPTQEQMMQVEQTLESRSRGFSEPLPPAQPSYQDLETPYYSMEPIQNEFARKAPVKAKKVAAKAASAASPKLSAKSAAGGGGPKAGGGGGPKAPAKKAPPKKNPWTEAVDPGSGQPYYYNEETGESTWDKPPEMNPALQRMSIVSRGW